MTDVLDTPPTRSAADESGLRDRVLALLDAGQRDAAIQAGRALLRSQPGLRSQRFLRKAAESDAAQRAGLKPYKIALLSSFSIEFVHDALVAYGFVNGLRLQLYQAGFGSFRQELLDPGSGLYGSSPDLVILAVEGEDWIPAAYGGETNQLETDVTRVVDEFRTEAGALISGLRTRSTAPALVHNFAPPAWRRLGILDAGSPHGQARLVGRLNDALLSIAQGSADVHLVDYASLDEPSRRLAVVRPAHAAVCACADLAVHAGAPRAGVHEVCPLPGRVQQEVPGPRHGQHLVGRGGR